MNEKLGIVEFRNIVNAIHELHEIDFTDYALTSLKRRVETFISENRIAYPFELIEKFKTDPAFFEKFLKEISVKDTEFFRDPTLWKALKDAIFQKILETNSSLRIWMPGSNSGEELYSLTIVLKEVGLLETSYITHSNICKKNTEFIKTGAYDIKKFEAYKANYTRWGGKYKLSDYYISNNNKAYMDATLLGNVEFIKYIPLKDKAPTDFNLIICRNTMLYFNKTLQNQYLEILYNSLSPGGFLVIGVKESLSEVWYSRFLLIDKEEKIYRKN